MTAMVIVASNFWFLLTPRVLRDRNRLDELAILESTVEDSSRFVAKEKQVDPKYLAKFYLWRLLS
jgi:hypothetical protein